MEKNFFDNADIKGSPLWKKIKNFKKSFFLIFSIFFQRGDPLMSKSSKKIFPFFKNFKNKTQK